MHMALTTLQTRWTDARQDRRSIIRASVDRIEAALIVLLRCSIPTGQKQEVSRDANIPPELFSRQLGGERALGLRALLSSMLRLPAEPLWRVHDLLFPKCPRSTQLELFK
jgi:hypothetical protein